MHGGTLFIPRFIFKPHQIQLTDIKSIERYRNLGRTSAILLARFEKSPILIERLHFISADDFEEFLQVVDQCASANQSAEFVERADSIAARSCAKNQTTVIFVSLTWLAIYAVLATNGNKEINDSALAYGALTKNAYRADEIYRIGSSFFLHLSPIHLGVNILSFSVIGRNIEIILGRVRLINILLLSAVCGSVFSYTFSGYSAVIGASGGIFGLLGAYFFLCVRHQRSFPGSVSTSARTISVALVLQFLFDITTPGVDVFSHVGGFLFGFCYGCSRLRSRTNVHFDSASPTEIRAAIGASTFYIFSLFYFFSLYFYPF